jgi:sodium-dependent dicarboxylate transporter 2/3/5
MYVFGVFPPDLVAKSYAKDAVIFIIGILAMSVGIAKSGLDRRIGLLLLGTSKSLPLFLFIFLPLLAVCASFLSEHALVAFIAPILMLVYRAAVKASGITKDPSLAVLLVLALCFAANQGGPGSPAAGGRNAIMIGILADYGMAPSFGQWVMYGMPFVPVMALVIAAYFYFFVYRKVTVKTVNVAAIVRAEAVRQGPMTRDEYITAATLVLVIVLWVMGDEEGGGLGMGGPVLLGIVILSIARIITWPDVNKISWDVVALYASASAMGAGLAATGAATWVATSFVENLPSFMASGEGLAIASSLFTGVVTNFMSDGATVAALGPVSVPMAQLSGTPPWMVGFATAFASSFANVFIIGTPNNAIAYSLAKDMDTGEQLVTLKDFAKHGLAVTILSLLVLWGWAILGYWQWIGFPS